MWFGQLEEAATEGLRIVHALDPELVWLWVEHEPSRPRAPR
ncbi:MAG: hypothetical protein ABIU87_09040 [Ornithinibacter sp.]